MHSHKKKSVISRVLSLLFSIMLTFYLICPGKAYAAISFPDKGQPAAPYGFEVLLCTASGDFNNDGCSDILVSGFTWDSSDYTKILLGNGSGSFSESFSSEYLYDLAVGDFNGDGHLDFVGASSLIYDHDSGKHSLALFDGNGDGTFEAPEYITMDRETHPADSPGCIEAGYINSDPYLDLIVSYSESGPSYILYNNGSGGFSSYYLGSLEYSSYPPSFVSGSFDQDGYMDLAVLKRFSSEQCEVRTWFGELNSTFVEGPVHSFSQNGTNLTSADFNNDGLSDLVFIASGGLKFLEREETRTEVTTRPVIDMDTNSLNCLKAADINGDGNTDVIGLLNTWTAKRVVILLGNGDFTFTPAQANGNFFNVDSNSRSIEVADFDGDGGLDIVVFSNTGVKLYYQNNYAPQVQDLSELVIEDHSAVFEGNELCSGYSDEEGNAFAGVKITQLPSNGTLKKKINSVLSDITLDEIIAYKAGDNVSFVFEPNENWYGETSYKWLPLDNNPITTYVPSSISEAEAVITVAPANETPTLDSIESIIINEDADEITVPLTGIGSGGIDEVQTITVSASSSNPAIIPSITVNYQQDTSDEEGSLSFTTAPNKNTDVSGPVTITVRVSDDGGTENGAIDTIERTFAVNILPINDPPSFTDGGNITVNEDCGATVVPGWASDLSKGSDDETGQALSFTVIGNTDPSLFTEEPTIHPTTGDLSFTPADNGYGSSDITVILRDNGGTASGGNDTSIQKTFTITVTPVNDKPTMDTIENLTIDEDSPEQIISLTGLSSGIDNEDQELTITVLSSNPLLIPDPETDHTGSEPSGTLRFIPTPDKYGTATLTVMVKDNGGTENGGVDTLIRTFTVTVRDKTAPVIATGYPKAGASTLSSVNILLKADEAGTAYAVCLPDKAPEPTSEQVKLGQNASGSALSTSYIATVSLEADTESGMTFSGLDSSTAYDVYILFEDTYGNSPSSPVKVDIATLSPPSSTSGSPVSTPVPSPLPEVTRDSNTNTTDIKIKLPDRDSTSDETKTTAAISQTSLSEAIKALDKASETPSQTGEKDSVVRLSIEIPPTGKNEIEARLPKGALSMVHSNGVSSLQIQSELVTFEAEPTAFGESAMSEEIALGARRVDINELPDHTKAQVPQDAILLDLNLSVGSNKVSQFEKPIKISVPYRPAQGEEKELLTVYLLRDDGSVETIGGMYNPVTGCVEFVTNHFSKYFIKAGSPKTFTDLGDVSWAKSAIDFASLKDYMGGIGANLFGPKLTMTRSQVAAVLCRIFKLVADVDNKLPYTDVSGNAWYYNSIKAVYDNSYMSGKDSSRFMPDEPITRLELTTIIGNILKARGYTTVDDSVLEKFKDFADIPEASRDSIAIAVKFGIINGIHGSFKPNNSASRAEVAVMLHRLMMLLNQ